jgi:MFS transporter, DHA1 family, inner membrane transport protein
VLHRALDDSYSSEVRGNITLLTAARTVANACFRFAPAFLATIASGLGVSLDRLGVALAISELSGLLSTATGSVAERLHRRTAMWVGLLGVAAGTMLAAGTGHVAVFTVALVVIAQSKVMFDLGLGAFLADRVPFEQRGRVMGITETSWAGGLLVGVTVMGLLTAATSWRWGYGLGAAAVVALAALVARSIPDDLAAHGHAQRREQVSGSVSRRGRLVLLGVFCLMASSQVLFVTFSSWLKDEFDMTDTGVSIVVFAMGFGELIASISVARCSDRWGKERAAAIGAAVMIPATLLLSLGHQQIGLGLPLLVVAIAAFEFSVVSFIPLGTEVVPGAAAKGMALMFTVGTFGRALASIPATALYVHHGMAWPPLMCSALAATTVTVLWRVAEYDRSSPQHP